MLHLLLLYSDGSFSYRLGKAIYGLVPAIHWYLRFVSSYFNLIWDYQLSWQSNHPPLRAPMVAIKLGKVVSGILFRIRDNLILGIVTVLIADQFLPYPY